MATPEQITELWRYNINLSTQYHYSSKYSATSKAIWKQQYRIRLYNKESGKSVVGLMDVSAIKYLREIAPGMAIKHMMSTPRERSCSNTEELLFHDPIQFHMQQGLSVAEMLFNGTSAAELGTLVTTMERGLTAHPESRYTTEGVKRAAAMVANENSDMVWELIQRYVDRTKCVKLYDGPWEKMYTDDNGGNYSGKVDVLYNEDAIRPFTIRVSNCATSEVYPYPVFPEKQKKMTSYLITLSAEEFIGLFLIPMCENSTGHQKG